MGESTSVRQLWITEFTQTLGLAWPLVIAQLAQMALVTTDVIMMGWLGPDELAAGTLASSFLTSLLLFGVGLLSAVVPMVAQAIGARDFRSVRRSTRQGFWVALAASALLIPIILQVRPVLTLLGQDPALVTLAETYIHAAVWLFIPALLIIVLRSFLSAHGNTSVILWVTVIGVFVNAFGDYALMFGNFGFPRLELTGAGISTVVVNTVMFALLLAYVLRHRRYRRYVILGRFWRPDWHRFREILRVGLPIGLMLLAEVGLFAVSSILMGWLGTAELAAHAVALQCASIAFMVPLGLSQAATVRAGIAFGRRLTADIGRAGVAALVLGSAFMSSTALLFVFAPLPLIHFYLDPANPANAAVISLAAAYLAVAGLFQLVDGAQVVLAGTLRGMSDTRVPMYVAICGYWLVGLPVALLLGFPLGMRGTGVWLGLASGLAFVALVLGARFARLLRSGSAPAIAAGT
ncbi:MAG TPA: MATE family efflux transporter [Devosiaceae bacterium]